MPRAPAPQDVEDVTEIKPWPWHVGRAVRAFAGRIWAVWSWLLVVVLGVLPVLAIIDAIRKAAQ
ncbi:MAG: hypothetical protein ACU0DT_17740 [Albimonas sp.]|uniref:hypothetical protein n=1 Tax=Albimonas sp. TaxID=1872425 RepID=UPI004057AD9F|tara:strand:- start:392 stop:583 length:192 start_codon:yes stop_codon:yes gene_type:complete